MPENMEHRMQCSVCGRIFCYTDSDVKDNKTKATWGMLLSLGTIASGLGGARYDMYEQGKAANTQYAQVKDFSHCPYCNSVSITEIGTIPVLQSSNQAKEKLPVSKDTPKGNPIQDEDEMVQYFREMLDMGIISQEEFEEQKRQLLGL